MKSLLPNGVYLVFAFLLSASIASAAEMSEEEAQVKAEQCLAEGCAKTSSFEYRTDTLDGKTSIFILDRAVTKINTSNLSDKLSDLNARISDTEITIILKNGVLFAFDKYDLRSDAVLTLDKVLEILQYENFKSENVRIEGHTDWIGSESYNQTLSMQRATSVHDWFVENGVDKKRLSKSGFGEASPIDTNETDAGRQNNRRVEIKIKRSK